MSPSAEDLDYSNLDRTLEEQKGMFDPDCPECRKCLDAMATLEGFGMHAAEAHPEKMPYIAMMLLPDVMRINRALDKEG